VLEVCWEHHRLVAGFAGQLNSQVPGIEGDKGEFQVLGNEMLLGELIEPRDGVSEGPSVSHMLPSQGRQAG
jgi:hypothetical protein